MYSYNNILSDCQYEDDPLDFKCKRDALESGFCEFHDEKYYLEHPENLSEKFHELIKESIKNPKEPLVCIGFHIVDCNCNNITFEQDVIFRSAMFTGDTKFISTEFTGEADFISAEFTGVANFGFAKFTGVAYFGFAKFTGSVYFGSVRFTRNVDFGSTEFTGEVNFGSAQLTGESDFYDAQFTGEADFSSAEFTGDADFKSAKFARDIKFISAEFTGDADFGVAKFTGETEFTGARFAELANFEFTEFTGDADFQAVKFAGLANFLIAQFTGKADFSSAEFTGLTYFGSAKFTGLAKFFLAQFAGEANFSSTEFTGDADFRLAKFSGNADFGSVKFTGNSLFYRTSFANLADFTGTQMKVINFSEAEIEGKAYFYGTKFEGDAIFQRTIFKRRVNFTKNQKLPSLEPKSSHQNSQSSDDDRTTFKMKADFSETKFTEEVDFREVVFNEKVNFFGTIFGGDIYFGKTEFPQGANFRRALFEKPEGVILEGDLSNFSFYQADISRIRFGAGVKWEVRDDSDKLEKQFKVKEELDIKNALQHAKSIDTETLQLRLEDVIGIYRNLKDNYELYARYDEAGQIFIREMEMKRNYREEKSNGKIVIKKRNWFARNLFATGLYHLTSNYGEGYMRPIIFTTSALIGSSLFFHFFENETPLDAFERAVRALNPTFSLPEPTSDPSGTEKPLTVVDYLLKVVFLPIAVTLFIALRRKLERKFRH